MAHITSLRDLGHMTKGGQTNYFSHTLKVDNVLTRQDGTWNIAFKKGH